MDDDDDDDDLMIFVTTGYGCQIWSFNVNVLAVAMFVSGARNEWIKRWSPKLAANAS